MKIFLLFILVIYLSGGVVANVIMLVRTLIHPAWDSYTKREYFIGFIGSWHTVDVLTTDINENDL